MIAPHLPALQVVVPLVAAPLCALLRRPNWAWGFATAITWAVFAMAITLAGQVLEHGVLVYEMGGWAAPWGIEYRIDEANAFVLVIVSMIGAVAMPYAKASVAREVTEDKQTLFYSAYLLCLTGLLGVTITGDAFNLFVFLEISSLSSYTLIAMGGDNDRRALMASYRYLIMGTIGATFYVIGIGLLYMVTGTLNIADLADKLEPLAANRTVLVAFAFLVTGITLKLALFPLHVWLPNAYSYAPSFVTVFLASTATKVAVYVLMRIVFTIFGPHYSFVAITLGGVLLPLALIGMFAGSLVAIFQTNLKRMLAYSSVAQIGYMVLGLSFMTVSGLTAGIVHLFNHALIKGGLFMAMGAVFYKVGSVHIKDFAGMAKRMPLTMAAIVVGGFGLIGVPGTAGFISKWYLILAALEQGWWHVAVLILVSSLLAVIYIWRIVEVAYFQEPPEGAGRDEAPLSMLIPIWVLTGASIVFGLWTEFSIGMAQRAAETLLRVGA